jgi:hypothetical protein
MKRKPFGENLLYCSNLPGDPNEPYYWGNITGSQFPDIWHLFDVANDIKKVRNNGRGDSHPKC